MNALVAAAEKEGQLNVITLPSNWANYGAIMSAFSAKYHIHITDANPDGSSQDELNAVNQLKGQSRAPDVLDVGTAFAVKGDQEGILAPYQVTTYSDIPSDAKASDATWYADYGGYVAIGYNSATVKTPPTSFKSLLNPIYKNQIAINGNPTLPAAPVRQLAVCLRHRRSPDERGPPADLHPDRVVPERERHRRPDERRQGARPGDGRRHRDRHADLCRAPAEGRQMAAVGQGGPGGLGGRVGPPGSGGSRGVVPPGLAARWVVLILAGVYFLLPLWSALRFAGISAFGSVIGFAGFASSLWLSVKLAIITTLIAIALMLPTAVYVHLRLPKVRRLLEGITILPIVIPPVVLIVDGSADRQVEFSGCRSGSGHVGRGEPLHRPGSHRT
ncbi:MAG: ABC transporter substrate-binding protein [Streptosporangiaceae bacterium]